MKLRLISLMACAALALGSVAFAQDNESPRERGGRGGMRHDPMDHMIERLNLTPDQKTKIQPILDEARPKMEEIRRDAMQKSKAVVEDAMAKIRPMLTTEQQAQLDQAKKNRRGGRQNQSGDTGGSDDNG